MAKVFFIDGGVVATTGNLYTKDIFAGDDHCPDGAIIISPPNGEWIISQDTGSIFDTYHVKSYVSASGIEVGNIYAFKSIYKFTIESYNRNRDLLKKLVSCPPEDLQLRHMFYQQQYAHVFSLFERFLCDTFVRQTCNDEETYHRVLKSGILLSKGIIQGKENRAIIKGEDCLKKELLYSNSIENYIVYHRFDLVSELFSTAFNISVDFSPLRSLLNTRHNIIHRFGKTNRGSVVSITEEQILSLINMVDVYVESISEQMQRRGVDSL